MPEISLSREWIQQHHPELIQEAEAKWPGQEIRFRLSWATEIGPRLPGRPKTDDRDAVRAWVAATAQFRIVATAPRKRTGPFRDRTAPDGGAAALELIVDYHLPGLRAQIAERARFDGLSPDQREQETRNLLRKLGVSPDTLSPGAPRVQTASGGLSVFRIGPEPDPADDPSPPKI